MDLLVNVLLSSLTSWVFGSMTGWLVDMYEAVLTVQNNTFFRHDFVSGLLSFFEVVGATLLVVGFVKRLIVTTEAQTHGDGAESVWDIFKDLLKAFGLLIFCRPIVLFSHDLLMYLADLITANLNAATGNITALSINVLSTTILSLISLIVAIVCSFIMLFTVLRQYAIMLIQIFTGYLYVIDVAGGGGNGLGEWARDVAGARIAFAMQLVFYKFGMMELANNLAGGAGLFVAVSCLLGASIVPSVLKRWGYANQTGSGALSRFASTAMMVLPRVVG